MILSFIFALLFLISFSPELEGFSVNASGPPCVRVFDAGQFSDQQSLRFYNACPDDLYINVCVLDVNNDVKLFSSARRVQVNGNYTITTLPGMFPKAVNWTADPFYPLIPAPCNVAQPRSANPNAPWWEKNIPWWERS